jgi:hypothetical protein
MSARFTYVSPAATIVRKPPEPSMHVVDGGYFEDSGAATASDILRAVDMAGRDKNHSHPELHRLRPYVIFIRYSEEPPIPFVPEENSAEGKRSPQEKSNEKFRPFSSELLSPMRAMLGARTARGQFAIEELKKRSGGDYTEILLSRDATTPFPLGWLLSAAARNAIDSAFGEGQETTAQIGKLQELFEPEAPALLHQDAVAKEAIAAKRGVEKNVGKLVPQAIFRSR